MKFGFLTVLFFLIISTNLPAQAPAETIPAFTFFKLNKTSFTNKDLALGRMVLFVFFDADCDHCQHAIQYLNQHNQEFKKAAIYLVTLDKQEKINGFMSKFGANLQSKKNVTILQDTQSEFLPKFRPRKYPSIFLYSSVKKLIRYDDNEQNLSIISKQVNK